MSQPDDREQGFETVGNVSASHPSRQMLSQTSLDCSLSEGLIRDLGPRWMTCRFGQGEGEGEIQQCITELG